MDFHSVKLIQFYSGVEKSDALSIAGSVRVIRKKNKWKEIWCRNGAFGVRTADLWEVCNNNSYCLSGVKKRSR